MLFSVTMDDVLYVSELMMNSFSLTNTLHSTQIGFERIGKYLALTINGNKLVFNKEVKGGSGVLLVVDIFPISNDILVEHATTIKSHERLHEPLGHPHQAIVTETARKYGWNSKPPIDTTCASCVKDKAKRKKIAKVAKNVTTMKGGRIFMDISSINV
jgi:hypothetical protein